MIDRAELRRISIDVTCKLAQRVSIRAWEVLRVKQSPPIFLDAPLVSVLLIPYLGLWSIETTRWD